MLFSIVKDPIVSANDLNHDLDIIYQWAHQWKMEFNPDPTKQATEVIFSCKKMKPNHPLLVFNGSAVTKVNEQKHLGLILESDLSFEKHLNEKMIKAKKNIGFLKHLSKFLPLKTLDQMYKALVRPHLDYYLSYTTSIKPTTPWCVLKCLNGKSGMNSIPSSTCYCWYVAGL